MDIIKKLCPPGLKNNPNKPLRSISYVTIHCTGNRSAGATARSHADYQYGGSGGNKTSWHYTVDAREIWQSFEDERACWHAGDGSGQGNYDSVAIEICVNDRAGFPAACKSAARLAAELLKKHKLGLERVVQHNKWSGKNCPAELRSGEWGVCWEDFLRDVGDYLGQSPAVESTPIMGDSRLAAADLSAFLLLNNPQPKLCCPALTLAAYYIEEGKAEGVRGDMAFCQAIKETGWFAFGGQALPEQNNFCGLGAENGGGAGECAAFETPEYGVRAHIQHLKAYASKDPLALNRIDPRFGLVSRGSAPSWEDLNGRWAVPGDGYGQSVMELYGAAVRHAAAANEGTAEALPANETGGEGEEDATPIKIDGRVYNMPRILRDGRNYIRLDSLKAAGFAVEWDETERMPILNLPKE